MKRMLMVATILLNLVLMVIAQEPTTAKDLYLGYLDSNGHTTNSSTNHPTRHNRPTGRPGAKINMELLRDNVLSSANTSNTFYSGDRVAFKLSNNFSGYVKVINIGTTEAVKLLYNDKISPETSHRIPKENQWIRFDDNPGTEIVKFIISSKPIQYEVPTSNNSSSGNNSTSSGGQVHGADENDILADINSRSMTLSRDLTVENAGEETYFLASSPASLERPKIFTIKLVHK